MSEPPAHDTNSASLLNGHNLSHHDTHDPAADVAARPPEAMPAPAKAALPLRLAMRQQQMPQKRIVDITETFTKACGALKAGQLVKDEYFTLFQSITALEIMDPKMDSGMLQPGETLEDDYDALKPLLPEEVIGIMDQLLCFEMAWHQGYPLSQTLFTSVYIDKMLWPTPRSFQEAQFYRGEIPESRWPGPLLDVLRIYCLGVIKCCDLVIARVQSSDYFEDEDFVTQTFNRMLFPGVPIAEFTLELDYAVDLVDDLPININDALRAAIISRLEFRKHMLHAVDVDLPISELCGAWEPVVESVHTMNTTAQLGRAVQGAFSTKIQRRLASQVPPRSIIELSFPDAIAQLKQLIDDCTFATRLSTVSRLPAEHESFLWAFATRSPAPLCYARSYMSRILVEEEMQSEPTIPFLDFETLVFTPHSPITDPANWRVVESRDCTPTPSPRPRISESLDVFTEQLGAPFWDYWTALCQNKCRLRRMLTRVVGAWDKLKEQAAVADAQIERAFDNPFHFEKPVAPLQRYVRYKTLCMAEKIVLLGFETNVYLPHEFAGMYLFLSMMKWQRAEILRKILKDYPLQKKELERANQLDKALDVQNRQNKLETLARLANGTTSIARALSNLYALLMYLHLVPLPSLYPFATEETQHELRMKPFLNLRLRDGVESLADYRAKLFQFGPVDPKVLPDQLVEALTKPEEQMWRQTEDYLREARTELAKVKQAGAAAVWASGVAAEWEAEMQGVLKTCVALGLAFAELKAAVARAEIGKGEEGWKERLDITVEVPEVGSGKRYLEGWAVPRIVRGKGV